MQAQPGEAAPTATAPRVVIVHSSDEMYGADRIVLHVVEALREHLAADVEVWLPDDVQHGTHPLCEQLTARGARWRHANLPVVRRAYLNPRGVLRLARASWGAQRELRRARPDVVYCATSACLPLAPLARLSGVRHVLLHIQEMWSGVESKAMRLLARFTTQQIAISSAVSDASKLTRPRPTVVVNCVDRPTPTDDVERTADATLRYVVASRWNAWKGHRTLLEAWDRAGCPGVLTVLGAAPTMGEAVDVRQLAQTLVSDPGSVDIVGEVADASPHLARADALVLPSDDPEPFGLVVIEAFAAGRPVIASRGGGPLEVITEGRDGWLFERRNADALADLLRSLTKEQLRDAGVVARQTYDERFTPERYRAQIAAVVAEAMASR